MTERKLILWLTCGFLVTIGSMIAMTCASRSSAPNVQIGPEPSAPSGPSK